MVKITGGVLGELAVKVVVMEDGCIATASAVVIRVQCEKVGIITNNILKFSFRVTNK